MKLPTLTAKEFAELCGVSQATVTNWMDAGMPCVRSGRQRISVAIDPAKAIPWAIDRREPPGSQRERLAAEQADKVAMENEVRRNRLVDIAIIEEVLMAKAAYLAHAHDAAAGRMAHELAGITDPGLIRARLLAEMREIRAGVAQHSLRVAGALDCVAQHVEHREAAAEPDSESVGGTDEGASRRKRGTRKVAQ